MTITTPALTVPTTGDQVFAALGEPNRLLIVMALQEHGEASVSWLTSQLPVSQPTVSHHLRVLTTAGLVTRREEGVYAYHRVTPVATGLLRALRRTLTRSVEPAPLGA
ncbi:ArsR/SmtB family transcription factor [Krasilnikovia sp. MM14-A1259]|uniref:ArsR/SmtB family transcription factor n=1 Tax=Krasilnikovia sp. MM14-A1259 TaxID=3373539 RepID=UPI00381CA581